MFPTVYTVVLCATLGLLLVFIFISFLIFYYSEQEKRDLVSLSFICITWQKKLSFIQSIYMTYWIGSQY